MFPKTADETGGGGGGGRGLRPIDSSPKSFTESRNNNNNLSIIHNNEIGSLQTKMKNAGQN